MTYNGIDYLSLIIGMCLGLIVYQAFDLIRAMIGWNPKNFTAASMISEKCKNELDFVYEKTGFIAHKVGDQPFNGFIKTAGNPEAEKVEEIIYRYSNNGYVFTDRSGRVFGRVCTIWTKADRIAARRARIRIIVNNDVKPA
jgi:hypothetical protein